MQLLKSTVGRKIIVAVTGQIMVLFVIVHLLGNSSIYIPGGINAYAEHLHSFPPLVWIFRAIMLTTLLLHLFFAIQITLENRAAKPITYAVNRKLKANFASENMIWTGLLLLAFITYHLLHFTGRMMPDVASRLAELSSGASFDVFSMVVGSFQHGTVVSVYLAAMAVLFLHMFHGIQSIFQTIGWNNDCTLPLIRRIGRGLAVFFLVGYGSIPVFIFFRVLS